MFKSSIGPFARSAAAAAALGLAVAAITMSPCAWPEDVAADIRPTAPDRYTVKQGDTLWGISSQFLREPWRWPELWRLNHQQVGNPHLIYPGQVLVLDRATGTLSVATDASQGGQRDVADADRTSPGDGDRADDGAVRVRPRVREEDTGPAALPSIPPNVIEPFLSRPLVIDPRELDGAPRGVATEEGHSTVGAGQRVYAAGLPSESGGTDWQIYRRGRPLVDPETQKPIADEAVYVGTARVVRTGEPASMLVRTAVMEVTPEDRLTPQPPPQLLSYVPHAPQNNIEARVIGIYGGRGEQSYLGSGLDEDRKDVLGFDERREAGPLQIVSVNRGSADGLELGHVLALYRSTLVKNDRSTGPWYNGKRRPPDVTLPEERYGLLFVFRTFEHVSYALIVQGQRPVVSGDVARKP
jgi:LysM repeat protein